MNYYGKKDFQHEYDCCELTKIKVIDWNAIKADNSVEKWEKWDKIVHEWIDNDKRHESCPLVEIEAPHGKLIDADKLPIRDISIEYYAINGITEDDINNAPTVIEAEE
jgi:hypothetical protein